MICKTMFFPLSILYTILFTIANTFFVPIAFTVHVWRLVLAIITQSSFIMKKRKFCELVQFLCIGHILLILGIFCDAYSFFFNIFQEH